MERVFTELAHSLPIYPNKPCLFAYHYFLKLLWNSGSYSTMDNSIWEGNDRAFGYEITFLFSCDPIEFVC